MAAHPLATPPQPSYNFYNRHILPRFWRASTFDLSGLTLFINKFTHLWFHLHHNTMFSCGLACCLWHSIQISSYITLFCVYPYSPSRACQTAASFPAIFSGSFAFGGGSTFNFLGCRPIQLVQHFRNTFSIFFIIFFMPGPTRGSPPCALQVRWCIISLVRSAASSSVRHFYFARPLTASWCGHMTDVTPHCVCHAYYDLPPVPCPTIRFFPMYWNTSDGHPAGQPILGICPADEPVIASTEIFASAGRPIWFLPDGSQNRPAVSLVDPTL